jgi:hypothetical protein
MGVILGVEVPRQGGFTEPREPQSAVGDDDVKEAGNEAAGRCTRTRCEATTSRASGLVSAKPSKPRDAFVDRAIVR